MSDLKIFGGILATALALGFVSIQIGLLKPLGVLTGAGSVTSFVAAVAYFEE